MADTDLCRRSAGEFIDAEEIDKASCIPASRLLNPAQLRYSLKGAGVS